MEHTELTCYTHPVCWNKHMQFLLSRKIRDLMACTQTGQGKAAAWLPTLSQIYTDGQEKLKNYKGKWEVWMYLISWVSSPTRELSVQIYKKARKFSYWPRLCPCVPRGGVDISQKIRDLTIWMQLTRTYPRMFGGHERKKENWIRLLQILDIG